VFDCIGDGALRLMPYQMGDQNQQWERNTTTTTTTTNYYYNDNNYYNYYKRCV